MNTTFLLLLFSALLSYPLVSQTSFQYDIKGNQTSAIYMGDTPCIDNITSSKDINIEENTNVSFKVFPNPFTEKFIIDLEIKKAGNYSLKIYDLSGKIIKVPIQYKWFVAGSFSREIILDSPSTAFIIKLSDGYETYLHKTILQIKP